MKIGFLGCGAMGSLYAGFLSQAHDVNVFDVWKENIDEVKKSGIHIDLPDGTTKVFHPQFATTDPNEIGEVDLLIVFVKYMLLEGALRNAKSMIGKNTIVLSLQNGMGNYDEIIKVVDPMQVCCGTTTGGSTFLGPGHIRATGVGQLNVGSFKGGIHKAEVIKEVFGAVGIEAIVSENANEVIWHKLFSNIFINAMTALLNDTNDLLIKNPYAHEFGLRLVKEAITVANATGCNLDEEAETQHAIDVAISTGKNRSSMLQDFDKTRETEIKIINGAVSRLGREAGVPTPYNDAIVALISAKQYMYLGK